MSTTSALIDEFTRSSSPEFQKIVERIENTISQLPVKLDAAIKWRQFTFALNGDYHHWICAISLTKKSVNLVFHYGSLLDDPKGILVAGESKFFRKIAFENRDQVEEENIHDLVSQAIDKNQFFKENWKRLNKQAD